MLDYFYYASLLIIQSNEESQTLKKSVEVKLNSGSSLNFVLSILWEAYTISLAAPYFLSHSSQNYQLHAIIWIHRTLTIRVVVITYFSSPASGFDHRNATQWRLWTSSSPLQTISRDFSTHLGSIQLHPRHPSKAINQVQCDPRSSRLISFSMHICKYGNHSFRTFSTKAISP